MDNHSSSRSTSSGKSSRSRGSGRSSGSSRRGRKRTETSTRSHSGASESRSSSRRRDECPETPTGKRAGILDSSQLKAPLSAPARVTARSVRKSPRTAHKMMKISLDDSITSDEDDLHIIDKNTSQRGKGRKKTEKSTRSRSGASESRSSSRRRDEYPKTPTGKRAGILDSSQLKAPLSAPARATVRSVRKSPRTAHKMMKISLDDSITNDEFHSIRDEDDLHIIDENTSERWQIPKSKWKTLDESLKSAKMRVDENFLLYTRVENAALQIQRIFRSKRSSERDLTLKDESGHTECDDSSDDLKKEPVKPAKPKVPEEPKDKYKWYTLMFVAFFAIVTAVNRFCWCRSSLDDEDAGGMDAIDDIPVDGIPVDGPAPGNGGGGGGGPGGGFGGVAPPPGLEVMASQAAGAAIGSAGTGISAAAAAGLGVTSAAATAAAGATAATATTQIITAVAVTSAVATAASTAGILFIPPTPDEVITTKCGLVNPVNRIGKFTMVFEGFPRTLDDRESNILEGLVLNAYNELTIGRNFTRSGRCLDPLKREMEEVEILEQSFTPFIEGLGESSSFLEILFQTKIVCDKCMASRPLFKNEQDSNLVEEAKQEDEAPPAGNPNGEPSSSRLLRGQMRVLMETSVDEFQDGTQFQDEFQDMLQDELASFDISGADFFQRLIQKVIFETEELSLAGELPSGFVRVAQAFVTPTPKENGVEVNDIGDSLEGDSTGLSNNVADGGGESSNQSPLFTQVKYQKQGDKGIFEFTFVDEETQETLRETVLVDPTEPNSVPVPTTSLPTFSPTKEPTVSPSTGPTVTFSGEPTRLPSKSPSTVPSAVPSDMPSNVPTIGGSAAPSSLSSTSPSQSPSDRPSFAPSDRPSHVPSDTPSVTPSESPSYKPSYATSILPTMRPSFVPSHEPTGNPSGFPSSLPSDAQSVNPSSKPSMIPSTVPVPSASPSTMPSMPQTPLPTILTKYYIGQGNCLSTHSFCIFQNIQTVDECDAICRRYSDGLRGFEQGGVSQTRECVCRWDSGYMPSPNDAYTCNANTSTGPITDVTPSRGAVECYGYP